MSDHDNLIHKIHDLDLQRGKALRTIKPIAPMLTDAIHALDHGNLAVVREFMDRAISELAKAEQALKRIENN
jgi:hypothetical protein